MRAAMPLPWREAIGEAFVDDGEGAYSIVLPETGAFTLTFFTTMDEEEFDAEVTVPDGVVELTRDIDFRAW